MRTKLLKCEPLAGFSEFRYNILLIGIIQAGKSSFFNTLASVFAEECKYPAPASRASTSVTKVVFFASIYFLLYSSITWVGVDIPN